MKDKYERLFSTDIGKEVLEDIKKSGMLNKSIFNKDVNIMSHDSGMLDLALHIVFMATPEPKISGEQINEGEKNG